MSIEATSSGKFRVSYNGAARAPHGSVTVADRYKAEAIDYWMRESFRITLHCRFCGKSLRGHRLDAVFCSRCCLAKYTKPLRKTACCVGCGSACSAGHERCNRCAAARRPPRRWTRDTIVVAFQDWAARHGGLPPPAGDSPGRALPTWESVAREFGSWPAAVLAAGLPDRCGVTRSFRYDRARPMVTAGLMGESGIRHAALGQGALERSQRGPARDRPGGSTA